MGKLIKWKNTSGSFRLPGRIIKPGQVFEAAIENIPLSFRDVVRPLEDLPEEPEVQVTPSNYAIRSRGPGWYDIIDSKGKVVNEKGLRREEAAKLLEELGN